METEVAYYLEVLLALTLTAAMFFFAFTLITELPGFLSSKTDSDQLFNLILARAMTLAVGVELIKMLSKPSPGTVIEVLLFALTRQLIVEHPDMVEFLLGVNAVAILFAVRRYLFIHFDDSTRMIVRGSQKIRMVNIMAHTKIKAEKDEVLRDFIVRKLNEKEETVSVGAVVYLKNVALRIDKMNGSLITRVELIKGHY
nr:hypothetical protein [Streptococcus catagoni]